MLGDGLGLFHPPRTALLTPAILASTPLLSSTTAPYTSLPFATHSSPSGNLVVILFARNTVNAPQGFDTVTWGGDPVTEVLQFELPNPPSAAACSVGWCGWIRGGLTGLQTLVVTPVAAEFNDLIGWVLSLDRLAVAPIGSDPQAAAVRVIQAAHSVTILADNADSLLLGAIVANDENLSPFTVSADWTPRDQQKTGNSGTGDITGILAGKTAGSTGAHTLTAATSTLLTTDDWGAIALEILPAA
jgi:hypothetical protein